MKKVNDMYKSKTREAITKEDVIKQLIIKGHNARTSITVVKLPTNGEIRVKIDVKRLLAYKDIVVDHLILRLDTAMALGYFMGEVSKDATIYGLFNKGPEQNDYYECSVSEFKNDSIYGMGR